MVQYDRMVLNHLLDTYENSLLSIERTEKDTDRVSFYENIYTSAYYDESSSEYEKFIF